MCLALFLTQPPCRFLLSPTSLLGLHTVPAIPCRMSNRDGRCLFDQLAARSELRLFFGRPPLRVQSLLDTGVVDLATLRRLSPECPSLGARSLLFPRSCVFPMGFAYSSYVARCKPQTCVLLKIHTVAGYGFWQFGCQVILHRIIVCCIVSNCIVLCCI